MISEDVTEELKVADGAPRQSAWQAFVLLGLILYSALYAAAEYIVYRHGEKSPLFKIATTPGRRYDFVILGASHAMPLAFQDVNESLESATSSSIMNLSLEGSGVVPNHFMLDYFLAQHEVKNVIYVVDFFAFYSIQWNEQRINDPKLLKRAPMDVALLRQLWTTPAARPLFAPYLTGFYKINDAGRFKGDVSENDGANFTRTYRGNATIDRQRIAYLYPREVEPDIFQRYLDEFRLIAQECHDRGIVLTVVRMPLPERVLSAISGEAEFNARIDEILGEFRYEVYDYSRVANANTNYYDTDHLNHAGIAQFNEEQFIPLLRKLKTEIQ